MISPNIRFILVEDKLFSTVIYHLEKNHDIPKPFSGKIHVHYLHILIFIQPKHVSTIIKILMQYIVADKTRHG